MSAFSDLADDKEFSDRWLYVWKKLEPHLLKMQRDYASLNKGNHAQIGQYVEFMANLMDEFNTITVHIQTPDTPRRKSLHNRQFQQ